MFSRGLNEIMTVDNFAVLDAHYTVVFLPSLLLMCAVGLVFSVGAGRRRTTDALHSTVLTQHPE